MKVCKKCKVANPDEAKFCRGCGINLNKAGHSSILKVILSIAAIVILGICIYAISESSSSDYIYTEPVAVVTPSSSTDETPTDSYNTEMYDDTEGDITINNSSESNDASNDTSNEYDTSSEDDISSSTSDSSLSIYRMVEVQWTDASYVTYRALIVIITDFSGLVRVKYAHPQLGLLWITQGATLTNYSDGSSIINCYNPEGDYASGYSADNFKIFPNGVWYTQDNMGAWSTAIVAAPVSDSYWSTKLNEYGIN